MIFERNLVTAILSFCLRLGNETSTDEADEEMGFLEEGEEEEDPAAEDPEILQVEETHEY